MQTVKEKIDFIDNLLNEYESSLGLPKIAQPGDEEELNKYLTMGRDVIEKLSVQECKGIAYRLSQFSLFLQRSINRESSRIPWLKTELTNIIAQSPEYDKFVKFDVLAGLIVKDNEYAKKLQSAILYAEQRSSRLTFLASSIKNLSDILLKGLYQQKNE